MLSPFGPIITDDVTPSNSFAGFLLSNEFLDVRFSEYGEDASPGLLDVIELWVAYGDATEVCPTFELYALAVIDIIEIARQGDNRAMYYNALWPVRDQRGSDRSWDAPTVQLPLMLGLHQVNDDGTTNMLSHHQALNRHRFELHQARQLRDDRELIRNRTADIGKKST